MVLPADMHALLRATLRGPFQPRLGFEESYSSVSIRMFLLITEAQELGAAGGCWGPGEVRREEEQPSQRGRFAGGVGAWLLAAARGHRLYPACAQSWAPDGAAESRSGAAAEGHRDQRLLSSPSSHLGLRAEPEAGQPLVLGGTAARHPAFGVTRPFTGADSRSYLRVGSRHVPAVPLPC